MDTPTKQLETYIEETLRQTVECAIFIKQYCSEGFAGAFGLRLCQFGRILKSCFAGNLSREMLDDEVKRKIAEFKEQFAKLQRQCTQGVAIQSTLVTYRVHEVVNQIGG